MNSFFEQLTDIKSRCSGNYCLTEDERAAIHNSYWNGNDSDICTVLEIMCFDPDPSDLPMLLDASSPSALDLHRIYAAEALGSLGDEGVKILRIMQERERHPLVRFYVVRELIDSDDESVEAFLDGPMPPNSSPNRRSLWIYGNFEAGELSKDDALIRMKKLLEHRYQFHQWLRDHVDRT